MAKFQEFEWDFEYEVICFDEDGKEIYTYSIEADTAQDAENVAREFCNDDYPNKRIGEVVVTCIGPVKN